MCLSRTTDSWRTVAPSNRKASPGGRLRRQATSVKPTCYFGRRVIVKGRWMDRERWKVKEGQETPENHEKREGGWRKRVWKEKARLFPGVAMPYLILDLTEAEDLVSNLRRICSSKMTRWHRLSVLSPSFRLHQNIES